jgi:hypothetical protein
MSKSLRSIRSAVKRSSHSAVPNSVRQHLDEAYAQYLYRMNLNPGPDSWFEFICARNAKRKIATPLRIIDGGVK